MITTYTHQLGVNGKFAVLIVGILHLLVGHELQGTVGHTKHARYEALVQPAYALGAVDLTNSVSHA